MLLAGGVQSMWSALGRDDVQSLDRTGSSLAMGALNDAATDAAIDSSDGSDFDDANDAGVSWGWSRRCVARDRSVVAPKQRRSIALRGADFMGLRRTETNAVRRVSNRGGLTCDFDVNYLVLIYDQSTRNPLFLDGFGSFPQKTRFRGRVE